MNTKVDEGKLISGKEALQALLDGLNVQYKTFCRINGEVQPDFWRELYFGELKLHCFGDNECRFSFRLKPRTITINGIEVPAPFEPKEGDRFWFISSSWTDGYSFGDFSEKNHAHLTQFGAWRTEEEIKQVVAALRQVFGGSHDN